MDDVPLYRRGLTLAAAPRDAAPATKRLFGPAAGPPEAKPNHVVVSKRQLAPTGGAARPKKLRSMNTKLKTPPSSPDTEKKEPLNQYSPTELRRLCIQRGISELGNKGDLLHRLNKWNDKRRT